MAATMYYEKDADLALLYARCELFLFPSLYEGFGLPVLEAMQCGAAVLVGDNSSLTEIVNRADLRCDTRSPTALAGAMTKLLREPAQRGSAQYRGGTTDDADRPAPGVYRSYKLFQ